MRLFIGIDLPAEIKAYFQQALEPLKANDKGWEHPMDLHLTLLFIGETDEALESIRERMKKISFTPFEIILSELEFFPRRVMFLTAGPMGELAQLNKQLQLEFTEYGSPHERPFLPHITVKRWQRWEYPELKKRIAENPLVPQEFVVKELTLFKSEKGPGNRKYYPISAESAQSCTHSGLQ